MPFASAAVPTVRAGALRESVAVTTRTVARDAVTGEETASWAAGGTFAAEVVPLTAVAAERAGLDVTRRPHRITARAIGTAASVAAGDRLTWRGLALTVLSVVDLGGRGRAAEILAVVTS